MRWAFWLSIELEWGSLLLHWSEYKANLRHAMNSTGHPDHNDVFNFVIWPKLEYLAQYFVSSVYPHKSFFPSCFEHDNVLGRCSFTLTSCLTTHTIITMQIVNFSASNSHFTNESSSNETTQLIIPPCLHSSLYSSCCIFCFDCVSSSPRPRTTTRCGKASTCSPYLLLRLSKNIVESSTNIVESSTIFFCMCKQTLSSQFRRQADCTLWCHSATLLRGLPYPMQRLLYRLTYT